MTFFLKFSAEYVLNFILNIFTVYLYRTVHTFAVFKSENAVISTLKTFRNINMNINVPLRLLVQPDSYSTPSLMHQNTFTHLHHSPPLFFPLPPSAEPGAHARPGWKNHMRLPAPLSPEPRRRDAHTEDAAAQKCAQLPEPDPAAASPPPQPRPASQRHGLEGSMANFDTLCTSREMKPCVVWRAAPASGWIESTITQRLGQSRWCVWLWTVLVLVVVLAWRGGGPDYQSSFLPRLLSHSAFERWSRSWCAPPWLWVSIWTRWTQISATMTGKEGFTIPSTSITIRCCSLHLSAPRVPSAPSPHVLHVLLSAACHESPLILLV